MKTTSLLICLGGCLLAAGSAQATLIDFNSLSEGTIVSNQYSGVTFAAGLGGLTVPSATSGLAVWATNTSMDVTLSTGGNVSSGVTFPISGMLLHGFQGYTNENGDPVFTITFASPISDISIDFGGVGNVSDSRFFGYKTGSTTYTYGATAMVQNTSTLSLSGMTNVTKIVVTPGDFNDWVGIDNINYTSSAVPEPGAIFAIGFGIVSLATRRRKSSR
jgi:hypothetical protein